MKKMGLVVALLLCCALALCMTGCGKGTVRGTVTWEDGSPAADVVIAAIAPNDYLVGGAVTNRAGRYVFEASPAVWHVSAWIEDPNSPLFQSVAVVHPNQETVLDITLPLEADPRR